MAFVGDQQPNFKHFCRICKKGFMCGRALGGHMRAHGIGDESGNVNDDDPASDWEEKIGRSDRGGSNGRMYALRTNPNRLKSCRVCENCGKEFSSWKSFLGHGKCRSGEVESPVSSPDYEEEEEDEDEDEEEEEEEEEETGRRGCSGWSKRKRTTRAKVEEEDLVLAKCLMQLSSARVDQYAAAAAENDDEESCASAGKVDHEEHQMRNNGQIRFLNPLSIRVPQDKAKGVAKGMFECKACKKVFNSHQALGGHRASHKKVKGCFAAKQEHFDETLINADVDFTTNDHDFFPPKSISSLQFEHGSSSSMAAGTSRRKSKVHECSVCHRIFSSGQALGGHKRCHWITSNSPDTPSLVPKFHHLNEQIFTPPQIKEQQDELDLNFPAPTPTDDNVAGIWRDPKNPLSFEVSTDIHLHPWIEIDEQESKNDKHHHNQQQQQQEHHHHQNKNYNEENNGDNDHRKNKNNGCEIQEVVDDGADCKVKLAKLSELKDMKSSGSSTGWLQVGIGSTTDHHVDEDP